MKNSRKEGKKAQETFQFRQPNKKKTFLSDNRLDIFMSSDPTNLRLSGTATAGEMTLLGRIEGSKESTLYAATVAFFVGLTAARLYGPFMATLNPYLKYSDSTKQFLVSCPNITGAILRIPVAVALETYSIRTINLLQHLCLLIGLFPVMIIMFSESYNELEAHADTLLPIFIICGLVAGIGIATFCSGIVSTGFWYSKEELGASLGFMAGFGNLSPAIFGLWITNAIPEIGVGGCYLLWFVFAVGLTYFTWYTIRDNPYFQLKVAHEQVRSKNPSWKLSEWDINLKKRAAKICKLKYNCGKFPTGNIKRSLIGSIKKIEVITLVITYFVSFGGFLALVGYFNEYWVVAFDAGIKKKSFSTFSFAVLAGVTRYFGGIASDKLNYAYVGHFAHALALLSAIILLFSSNYSLSLFAAILAGCGFGISNAVQFKAVSLVCGNYLSGATAWIGSIGATGGFIIPRIMEAMGEGRNKPQSYKFPWLLFVVLWGIVIVLWLLLTKRITQQQTLTSKTPEKKVKRTKKGTKSKKATNLEEIKLKSPKNEI